MQQSAHLLQMANGKAVTQLHHTTGFCQPALTHSSPMSIKGSVDAVPQQNMANHMNLLCQLVMAANSRRETQPSNGSPSGDALPTAHSNPSHPQTSIHLEGASTAPPFSDVRPTAPSSQPPTPASFANLKLNFADKPSFFNPYTLASTPPGVIT